MKSMTMKTAADHKPKPGELTGASLTFSGNGGVIVNYEHCPEATKKGDVSYPGWSPRQPDTFGSVEEACHAIVQARGGKSQLAYEAAEEKAEGK